MNMDLNSLARTLAERAADDLWNDLSDFQREITASERDAEYAAFIADAIGPVEIVIREAIEKTLEEAARLMDERAADPYSDSHLAYTSAAEIIRERARSLKQSNSVAEDEGPCAACGQPKSDSAMHLDSPGKGWGAALHWFKQSNSGMEVRK